MIARTLASYFYRAGGPKQSLWTGGEASVPSSLPSNDRQRDAESDPTFRNAVWVDRSMGIYLRSTLYFDVRKVPWPRTLEEIRRLMQPSVSGDLEQHWQAKKTSPRWVVAYVKKVGVVGRSDENYELLNRYLFFRACQQANEACNKLWAVCELYHHICQVAEGKHESLAPEFSSHFLPSSTVPTLYYGEVAAMISILSSYGLGSLSMRESGKTPEYYNLVRTEDGFRIFERHAYIRDVLGATPRGWHEQVLTMYELLPSQGLTLRTLDLGGIKKLQTDRTVFDYDILGKTTMDGAYGENRFLVHLPHAVETAEKAIEVLTYLRGEPLHNKCDIRFDALKARIPRLMKRLKLIAR